MPKNYSISLIMPCRDEAIALKTVLERLPKEIDEVIVVDNNSSDKTKQVARDFGARIFSETRTDKNGIGYGFAIQKGISEAKGNIIVCMDGDGSYPVNEIPNLVNHLIKKNLDFISCNRTPFKNKKNMSSIRTFGVRVLSIIFWILYGYKIQDSLSGMWIFRRKAVNNVALFEGGWNFSLEIKLKMARNPLIKFAEQPIFYHDRVFDSSKQNLLKTGFQHLLFLLKNRFNYSKSGLSLLQPKPLISSV